MPFWKSLNFCVIQGPEKQTLKWDQTHRDSVSANTHEKMGRCVIKARRIIIQWCKLDPEWRNEWRMVRKKYPRLQCSFRKVWQGYPCLPGKGRSVTDLEKKCNRFHSPVAGVLGYHTPRAWMSWLLQPFLRVFTPTNSLFFVIPVSQGCAKYHWRH